MNTPRKIELWSNISGQYYWVNLPVRKIKTRNRTKEILKQNNRVSLLESTIECTVYNPFICYLLSSMLYFRFLIFPLNQPPTPLPCPYTNDVGAMYKFRALCSFSEILPDEQRRFVTTSLGTSFTIVFKDCVKLKWKDILLSHDDRNFHAKYIFSHELSQFSDTNPTHSRTFNTWMVPTVNQILGYITKTMHFPQFQQKYNSSVNSNYSLEIKFKSTSILCIMQKYPQVHKINNPKLWKSIKIPFELFDLVENIYIFVIGYVFNHIDEVSCFTHLQWFNY